MLTLGCLPLWGRERVTLPAAAENKRITQKKRVQQSQKNMKLSFVTVSFLRYLYEKVFVRKGIPQTILSHEPTLGGVAWQQLLLNI
jgi:hypothetical protein